MYEEISIITSQTYQEAFVDTNAVLIDPIIFKACVYEYELFVWSIIFNIISRKIKMSSRISRNNIRLCIFYNCQKISNSSYLSTIAISNAKNTYWVVFRDSLFMMFFMQTWGCLWRCTVGHLWKKDVFLFIDSLLQNKLQYKPHTYITIPIGV